jgi:hypothetical protein
MRTDWITSSLCDDIDTACLDRRSAGERAAA